VVATSLQDDLLSIPGVEGAEIDGSQDAPSGLRIRIVEGADQEAVGGAIRRVLSSHGLGTDTLLPGEAGSHVAPDLPPESEQEPELGAVAVLAPDNGDTTALDDPEEATESSEPQDRAIIDLTDKGQGALASDEGGEDGAGDGEDGAGNGQDGDGQVETEDGVSEQLQATVAPDSLDTSKPPPFVEPRSVSTPSTEVEPEREKEIGDSIARIDSVAVVEGRTGVVVTVAASSGDEMSHVASSSEGGVEAAVVTATAKLVDPDSPDPIVVEIEDRRVEGVDIVMIVLDMDGRIVAGSAIVEAGRAFALGRATWAALAL
jgi:hypothetical protein